MLASLSQAYKCLYCIWPALVAGVGWWLSSSIEAKTYYGSLTPGVDPASPQGQAEFETRRQRDKEKRHIIYWCIGIIVAGYLIALAASTFTVGVKAKAAPAATDLPTAAVTQTTPTLSETPTPIPSGTPSGTLTPLASLTQPTYPPTATNRVIYVAGPQITVIVTVIVTREVTVKPTKTPTPTITPPSSETLTGTFTETPTETPTQTPTWTPDLPTPAY